MLISLGSLSYVDELLGCCERCRCDNYSESPDTGSLALAKGVDMLCYPVLSLFLSEYLIEDVSVACRCLSFCCDLIAWFRKLPTVPSSRVSKKARHFSDSSFFW